MKTGVDAEGIPTWSEWSDRIRTEVKTEDGNYVWQDAPKSIEISSETDWGGKFASLPLVVPSDIEALVSDDVDVEYEQLIQEDWTALFTPVAAPAFGNRKICYFWNSEIGFIELVNK